MPKHNRIRKTLRRRIHHKKCHTRKRQLLRIQSGGNVDFNKLKLVLNNRSRASELASISAKKAQELKELIESV
jgi:hypothetical protein